MAVRENGIEELGRMEERKGGRKRERRKKCDVRRMENGNSVAVGECGPIDSAKGKGTGTGTGTRAQSSSPLRIDSRGLAVSCLAANISLHSS